MQTANTHNTRKGSEALLETAEKKQWEAAAAEEEKGRATGLAHRGNISNRAETTFGNVPNPILPLLNILRGSPSLLKTLPSMNTTRLFSISFLMFIDCLFYFLFFNWFV